MKSKEEEGGNVGGEVDDVEDVAERTSIVESDRLFCTSFVIALPVCILWDPSGISKCKCVL